MKKIVSLFLLFYAAGSFAQSLQQKIENAYSRFENDQQLKFATSSLTVLNARTGEIIFSKNGSVGLVPASTLKTITSVTAYQLLGKDFTWETSLGYNGTISSDGVLTGDLIITGGGDPSLGSERYDQTKNYMILRRWVDALRRSGIKTITGRVIADDRLFGTQTVPGGWTWQDMGNYYGAGPSSLTWNENQFDLIFKPGAVGEAAELVRTEPEMSYLKIVNEVTTGRPGTGDNVYAYSSPYSNLIYLRGTYGSDLKKVIAASIPDPAFDVAYRLTNSLKASGVKINNTPITARQLSLENQLFQPPAKIIDLYSSPSLEKIVYWFNQKSINLYGEHLLKTIAWKQGKDIKTEEGVKVIKEFWNKRISADPNSVNISDGSGLSPANRITTLTMAQILQSVKTEPWFASFYESLPLYNNMKMKSGTISDVIGYTGYQTSSNGTPLVFSIIVNNYSGSGSSLRQKLFSALDALK